MLIMRVRLAQLKLRHPVAILAYAIPDLPNLNHDRISRLNLLDIGASASYAVNRKTNLVCGLGPVS